MTTTTGEVPAAAAAVRPRREQLLDAAARLFAERGYHDVGIDDIGAAVGISGPGIYRHFAGKQALLEELVDRGMTRILDVARSIPAGHPEPLSALEALVDLHVGFAVAERSLIAVWGRETRALSEPSRHTLRRQMREYEDEWARALTPLRSDLDPAEVRSVTVLALTLLNGSAVIALDLTPEVRALLLRQMTLAAMLARSTAGPALPPSPSRPARGAKSYGGPQAHIGRGRS